MEIIALPRRREERIRNAQNAFDRSMGLIFCPRYANMHFNFWTCVSMFIVLLIFGASVIGGCSKEYFAFSAVNTVSTLCLILCIRTWWIYACKPDDSAVVITMKIVASSLLFLFSSALTLTGLFIMHTVKENEAVSNLTLFVTYFIMVVSLTLNIANCMKLIFLIIIFARQYHQEQYDDRRFDERTRMILQELAERQQADNEIEAVEQLQDRERRHRRRRILRHLRNRGVQEGTIDAIRHILEAALERNDEDSPEERVKIYSRIMGCLYDKEKHGEIDNCPICCEDFVDEEKIKVLPDCSHLFHEDCIEQWILKSRSSQVSCPVCRIEIVAALEAEEDTQNDTQNTDEEMNVSTD